MKTVLRILNIVALLAIAFLVGKSILNSKKADSSSSEDAALSEESANEAKIPDFVEVSPKKLELSGIESATAGPATLHLSRTLFGQFRANEEKVAHIAPRFAGIIQDVGKRLGDPVEKNETVVTIESNESLEDYDVKSLISGTIIFRNANRGEAVTEGQRLMTVADLTTLWVDLNAYPQDYGILKLGQPVSITSAALDEPIETKIDYISPFGTEGTQTMLARVTVPNLTSHLRPGLFAEGKVLIANEDIPLSVENSAIQKWEDNDVVFVREDDGFKATPVQLGRSDENFTEILSGIEPGTIYAAENSFLLKAELGKSSEDDDD